MNQLTTKGYARIYVDKPEDVEKVKAIIKEIDAYEFEHYLPKDLIAPFSEYPKLTYTHKFNAICMNKLTALCWLRGIKIWVLDNGYSEFVGSDSLVEIVSNP